MKAIGLFIAIITLIFATAPQSHAERVIIPAGSQYSNITMPNRGTSKFAVAQRFGEPLEKIAPVGQPPISQWVYGNFTVYFEYNHVVHSVAHKR